MQRLVAHNWRMNMSYAQKIEELVAERDTAAAAMHSALRLVADIRWALGDEGSRMQSELIDHARQLLKDAESYRHLRDRSKTRLRVWRPQDDGGAAGPFDLGHLDAEIAAEIGCTPAVG